MKVAGQNYFIKGSVSVTVRDFEAPSIWNSLYKRLICGSYLAQTDIKLNQRSYF